MMYAELYQYLILHKELPVPGIGIFLLERRSAELDFVNRQINPPIYSVALQANSNSPSNNFFKWLANILGITDRDAVIRFNDFVFDMKKQISAGDTINWNGIGTLSKGLTGEIKLSDPVSATPETPVHAEKVIREKSGHMVRVGEEEKTSAEMTEMLSKPEKIRSYWWVYALVLGLLSMLFIGWYFYEHEMDISSTTNTRKFVPTEATASYQVIQ